MRGDMGMVVTLFLALAAMVIGYAAFGQGGGVAGMVFFGVLLLGAIARLLQNAVSNADVR
jgi:ribose/xylose/arabinose/galactoside ABC-type transport system permease subunit